MPATPAPQSQWIDKEAVAKRLKISPRTANNLAETEKIKARKVRSLASNQLVWMFNAGDVERYAFERDNPNFGGLPAVAKQAEQPSLPAVQTNEWQQAFNDWVAAGRPTEAPDAKPRPWLTLDEAAEYSGLTKRWLLQQAESALPEGIRDMGKHSPGGRWRFHRESLDKA